MSAERLARLRSIGDRLCRGDRAIRWPLLGIVLGRSLMLALDADSAARVTEASREQEAVAS